MCRVVLAFAVLSGLFVSNHTLVGQERIVREVPIYLNLPEGDDNRSQTEMYYEPYYVSPAAKGPDVGVDMGFFAKDLEPGKSGTVIEVKAVFDSANEFVTVGWVPANAKKLGAIQGLNMAEKLSPGKNQKVYLELKARRRSDDEANVSFRVGGLAGFPHKDSLRPAAQRSPDLDRLTADWVVYRVDLTNHAQDLNAVLCPLQVTIEVNQNSNARRRDPDPVSKVERPGRVVTLFIDDVRFICVEP